MADGGDVTGLRQRPIWIDVLGAAALFGLALVPAVATMHIFLPVAAITVGLGVVLAALAVIDLRRMILPDVLTLPLILAGLALSHVYDWDSVAMRALGAIVGFLLLYLASLAYRRLRGRDGLGLGDAKLFAAAGAWLGLAALPQVLLGACLLALAGVAALFATGRRLGMASAIPFGPFLAFSIWLTWLYGIV